MLPIARCAWVLSMVALPAQRDFLEHLPAHAEASLYLVTGTEERVLPIELPGEGEVVGFAKIADRCWVARGAELHCLDWPSGKLQRSVPAPADLVGLCADDRFVYGWVGTELHVFDPIAGVSVRTVPIAAAWSAKSITMHRSRVYALVDHTVLVVDLQSGAVETLGQAHDVSWLASDGVRVWGGTGTGCRVVVGETPPASASSAGGSLPTIELAWPWPVVGGGGAAAWIDGRLLVASIECKRTPGWLGEVFAAGLLTMPSAPGEQVSLKIYRDGAGLKYELGPSLVIGEPALVAALQHLCRHPSCCVPGPDGKPMPMPIVLEVYPGVEVADLRRVWDLAIAAGFPQVSCPAQEAWARRQAQGPGEPARK